MQEALTQFPQALQPAQEALTNFPQALEPATQSLAQFPAAIEPVTSALTQTASAVTAVDAAFTALTANITASSSAFTENTAQVTAASAALAAFSAALQATLGALAAFTAALMGAIGGITSLGSAAAGAAGSVSSLGAAAASAAAALQSAASSIASAAASAASAAASASAAAASAGGGAKANYRGGIYNKGAFLTWFAEKSPEAAIPLDKSQRAINLWTQAGQMLGVLPSDNTSSLSAEKPQTNSTQREIFNLQRAKTRQAQKVYESVVNQLTMQNVSTTVTENTALSNMASTVQSISNVQNAVQNLQAAQFDELGNIIGLNGAAGNVITKYDNDKIKHVKQQAQIKEFESKQAQIDKVTREVVKTSTNTSFIERISEKFSLAANAVKEFFGFKTEKQVSDEELETQKYKEVESVKEYETSENVPQPRILTERQRYQSEDVTKEKTLERIANSRSYQAIVNAQRNNNQNSTSILNRGELNTKIATDVTGGLIGKIFGTDFGLGQIFTRQKKIEIDPTQIMTSTYPMSRVNSSNTSYSNVMSESTISSRSYEAISNAQRNSSQNSTSILNRGDLNTSIITDITGGIITKIFGTDLGLGQIMTRQKPAEIDYTKIMTQTIPAENQSTNIFETLTNGITNIFNGSSNIFSNIFGGSASKPKIEIPLMTSTFPIEQSPTLLERINAVNSSERLESVYSETATRDYSAAAFQPTFNISVTVNGSGENVDTKSIGEKIAYSARESFEKEFERFMHEKTRRGFV